MDRCFSAADAILDAMVSKREEDLKSKMCDEHGDSGKETSLVRGILDNALQACTGESPLMSRDKMKAAIWVGNDVTCLLHLGFCFKNV